MKTIKIMNLKPMVLNQLPKIYEAKGRNAVKKNSNTQNRGSGTVNPEGPIKKCC